eukprot:3878806-Prymnesium_polylepis.1
MSEAGAVAYFANRAKSGPNALNAAPERTDTDLSPETSVLYTYENHRCQSRAPFRVRVASVDQVLCHSLSASAAHDRGAHGIEARRQRHQPWKRHGEPQLETRREDPALIVGRAPRE